MMKATARLHAHLLARKGEALPAIKRQRLALADVSQAQEGGPDTAEDMAAMMVRDMDLPQRTSGSKPRLFGNRPHDTTDAGDKPGTSENIHKKQNKAVKVTDRKRIALTLRLDKKRHLSLKLLSAHQNKSGQELMIEALDALLETYEAAHEGCPCLSNLQGDHNRNAQNRERAGCPNRNNTCQAKN